ncbi:hypothetical protein NQZ68_041639 [Dissostichus eleginoides]|nr:hypothetical protein NQZ68_041639 [Dissostichus eleginoides]
MTHCPRSVLAPETRPDLRSASHVSSWRLDKDKVVRLHQLELEAQLHAPLPSAQAAEEAVSEEKPTIVASPPDENVADMPPDRPTLPVTRECLLAVQRADPTLVKCYNQVPVKLSRNP